MLTGSAAQEVGEEKKVKQDASVNRLPWEHLRFSCAETSGRRCRTSLRVIPTDAEQSEIFIFSYELNVCVSQ